MIDNKWLRMCGNPTLATAIFLLSSACFVNGIGAQSVESVEAGSLPNPVAHPAFLVAPSISLGFAPSSVATGDLRRNGKLDLVTADCQSGNISVFLGAGQGKFGAGAKYAAGACPSSVTVADINGDGRPDVLVSNESQGTIGVLLGNGDGSLQPLKSYTVGFNPSFIAAGEFDGSGKVEVAVAGASGNHLAVLLNDGSGNLQKPVSIAISKTPAALTVADFNNDGHSDLALANADGTVTILLGQGGAVFHALPDIRVASQSLSSIAFADFNKDGKIDLAVTQPGRKLVSVLMGNGDGTFASPASYSVGNEAVSTLVADVDGDGIPDLVVINKLSNTFSVLGGSGDGTFKTSLDYVAGNAPLAAVAGDFYGNGHVDLAIINHSSQTVSVPAGNGDSTFKASRSYEAGQQPVSIASGNLSGGKLRGLVVANYCGSDSACGSAGNVAVFLADDKGDYKLSSTYAVGAGPVSVSLVDVNGDKNLDIIALNRLDKTVSVLLGGTDGTFQRQVTIPLESSPIAVGVGDFNKDGNTDLAVLEDCGAAKCSQPGSLEILTGKGDGSFQSAASYTVGYSPISLAIGDINEDKALDILVANRCGKDASCASPGTATMLMGDGSGKFTAGKDLALGNSPSSIAFGNLSGNNLDLLVSRSSDNTVAVLRGNGDGTFKAAVPYPVGNQPGPLVMADFNGDGIADVAITNFKDSTVSVLFGNGDGTLQPATDLPVGAGPVALTAIGASKSRHASLATANGNSGASTPGTDFSVLPNLQTDPPLASFVLVPSPTPTSNVNEGVTLTATLTGSSPDAAPTGTVTFDSGSGALTDCSSVAITPGVSPSLISTASCTTHLLLAGTDSLTAVYSGDSTYDTGVGETSPAVMQTVHQLQPTLTLSPSPTSTVNSAVTFTATLGGVTITPIGPSGTVAFTARGNPITCSSPATVNATGVATCTTSSLDAGTDSIGASYPGDGNYKTANASTINQTVKALTPTLGLSAAPSSTVSVGTQVTFTAQLSGTVSPVVPTGTVTWSANTGCGASTVNSSGAATCATSSLVTPADVVSATYAGDSNYVVASPGQMTETVDPSSAAAVVSPAATPPSPFVNQPVVFTAQVWAPASEGGHGATVQPAGSVSFTEGGVAVCSGAAIVAGTQTATCAAYTFPSIPSGSRLTATFTSADLNFPSGTTGSTTVTVQPSGTSTTLSSSPAAPVVNQQVNFTAVVTPAFSGTAVPQGTVVFSTANPATAGSILCTETLSSGVVPPCPYTFTSAVSDNVFAIYTPPGGANFAGSVSSPDSLTIGPDPTTTTVAAAWVGQPATLAVNQQVTFTATVTPTFAGTTHVSGTVSFAYSLNGGASVGIASCGSLNAAAAAVCTTKLPSSGSYAVTATYTPSTGPQNFAGGSGSIIQPVGATSTTTTVSGPASLTVSAPATFTATITPNSSGSATPTGTVTFTYTTSTITTPVVLCAAVAVVPSGSNGSAPCPTSLPAAGIYTILATYTSGDTNFTGSSGQLTQTVGKQSLTVTVGSPSQTGFVVNQAITFTATLTPSIAGATSPTQTVEFIDTTATTSATLCSVNIPSTSNGTGPSTATCTHALLTAGAHTITASYLGDINYPPQTSSNYSETVGPAQTAVAITSNLPVSVATQGVIFTAIVTQVLTPATTGTAVPKGTIAFTSSDGTANSCAASVLTSPGDGTAIATCNVTFPKTTSGQVMVTATYNSSDLNFAASSNSGAPFTQAVQNFGVAFTAPTSNTVILTQGYNNSSDPFNPVAITVSSAPVSGFNDPLNVSCTVTNTATGNTVTDPSCTPSTATLAGNSGSLTYEVTASASTAGGKYSVTLSAVDSNQPALSHATTLPLSIYVVPLASPMVVTAGVTGTENVEFDTASAPAGSSLVSFKCGTVVLLTNGVPGPPQASTGLSCTGPSGGVAVAGVTTTAQISISPLTTTAALQRSTTIYAATLLGMPLLALLGWAGSRKSGRKNLFRALGLVLLMLGASYAVTGCGGSYTRPPLPPASAFPAGSYYVQVVATDGNGNSYYAVVPLTVNPSLSE
jgi:hypothetical protein